MYVKGKEKKSWDTSPLGARSTWILGTFPYKLKKIVRIEG
jgi:hypothetical protein